MSDELKAKIAEAMTEARMFTWNDHVTEEQVEAGLQAIHEEGLAIVPNGVVDALQTAEAWLTNWGSHVGNCVGGTRCTCGLEAVSAEIGHAIYQAHQPKTKGEGQ